jgi:hypothetical protein
LAQRQFSGNIPDQNNLVHGRYGPLAYSCYDVVPNDTSTIYVVANPSKHQMCINMLGDLQAYLQHLRPRANLTLISGSIEEDFAALWKAPLLIKDAQSTFGLWAGFAGEGRVYAVPMLSHLVLNTTPDLGAGWNWRDCPTLDPKVAKAANISTGSGVISWLRDH